MNHTTRRYRFRQLPEVKDVRASRHRFGAALKRMRLEEDLSVRTLASIAGITSDYIYKLERGEIAPPADERILQLAKANGGNVDELFSAAGRMAPDIREVIESFPKETGAILRKLKPLGQLGRSYVLERVSDAVAEVFAENKSRTSPFLIAG